MGEEQRDTWIDDMGRVHNVIVHLGCETQSKLLPISLTASLPLEKKRCHIPSVKFIDHRLGTQHSRARLLHDQPQPFSSHLQYSSPGYSCNHPENWHNPKKYQIAYPYINLISQVHILEASLFKLKPSRSRGVFFSVRKSVSIEDGVMTMFAHTIFCFFIFLLAKVSSFHCYNPKSKPQASDSQMQPQDPHEIISASLLCS